MLLLSKRVGTCIGWTDLVFIVDPCTDKLLLYYDGGSIVTCLSMGLNRNKGIPGTVVIPLTKGLDRRTNNGTTRSLRSL